jgi:hypothetical protein
MLSKRTSSTRQQGLCLFPVMWNTTRSKNQRSSHSLKPHLAISFAFQTFCQTPQTKHLSSYFSQASILAFTKSVQTHKTNLALPCLIRSKLHFLSLTNSAANLTNKHKPISLIHSNSSYLHLPKLSKTQKVAKPCIVFWPSIHHCQTLLAATWSREKTQKLTQSQLHHSSSTQKLTPWQKLLETISIYTSQSQLHHSSSGTLRCNCCTSVTSNNSKNTIALQNRYGFDPPLLSNCYMLSKGLSMLVIMMCLLFEMNAYSWSYAIWKFDDIYLLCSNLELWEVLVKTMVRVMMVIACWSFPYAQF